MARVLCAYSGIDYKVEHLMIYNTARESHHPVFDMSIQDLLALSDKYLEGKLTATDNYLVYLALFNATELVDFRVPAIQTDKTQSIIANNMIPLFKMLNRIHTLGDERVRNKLQLPQFVISPDTKDLSNSHNWIKVWEQNYEDYLQGYKHTALAQILGRKEEMLERKIKDKDNPSSYSALLADWAALAGDFHSEAVLDENDNIVPAVDYWKRIIRLCAKGDSIFHIPLEDIDCVIEQCEENVFNGNGALQANILMHVLRNARTRRFNYEGLRDIDISTAFRILDPNDSVEDANMLAIVMSAPKEEPIESQYPNKLAYRMAKIKYQQAVEYYKANPSEKPVDAGRRSTDTPADIPANLGGIGGML
jgi:hypothetical protein